LDPNLSDWQWHAGDPTALGWLTLLAYLLCAVACWRAWRACRSSATTLNALHPAEADHQARLSAWWLGVGGVMLLLGLNKELDLQTLLGLWGKQAAREQGWYAQRRVVQGVFVAALVLAAVAALGLAAYTLRQVLKRIALGLAGLGLVFAYALLRAALFHTVRDPSGQNALAWVWPLELAGIALVAWAAWRAARPWRGSSSR
jgi:hypothetical protein